MRELVIGCRGFSKSCTLLTTHCESQGAGAHGNRYASCHTIKHLSELSRSMANGCS
jgi:hypothetical protein